ncbi:MAG: ROK family protein [Steroidobacteraceae bacterium]
MARLASEPTPVRIGIDLGGTKSEVIALDSSGETLFRRRKPTPADDYAAILDTLCRLVAEAEASAGRRGRLGMATPGAVSQSSGRLKNSNTVALNGRRPDLDLAERLGRDVRLENDANCFALSEAVDGAGAQARVVLGVILGTGVGGGLIVDRHILHGRNRIAGEWGHNPLPWPSAEELPGPPCYCGRRGCIETFLSGPGLARDFEARTGVGSSAEDIVGAARDGSAPARACLTAYLDRLARGLATVINVLDPEVIVLGGGLSNITELYRELPCRLSRYTFSDTFDTPIVPAVHGDSSGVRGAAWLA